MLSEEEELEIEAAIPEVKQAIVDHFNAGGSDEFDELDYTEAITDDWFARRFLLQEAGDRNIAARKLIEALKWRKQQQIRHRKDADFPSEFYEIGALFTYREDRSNRPSLFLRIKFIRKIPELKPVFKQFLVHKLYKIDTQSQCNGFALVIDFKDASIKNCDIELVSFLISTLKNYFPYGVRCILVNELPWILSAFWKLVESLIPQNAKDIIKCTTYETLEEYFERYNLPDFAGGYCCENYREVPENCISGESYGTEILGASVKDVRKMLHKYKSLISA
ncbi:motile sperm domain-containing protein 2-like protein [Dinothrombium tinctorium]|uniref:Motile sperm domain-containing protein 2-like protein n=1 Tax=Dinothrombium tinctorium TaxID=1965070 RepID=A0A3S3PYS9_9ACAR|nr:motile sperm domain-containing protein 2-like protein [Dinothrombium tinctorium]RWS10633.1 motile sperm domain-containing protein 2-like protein [Dinothrombium tinctorium]